MLARAQRVDDLLRMQRRRRHEEYRLEIRLREHLGIVARSAARRRDGARAQPSSSATRIARRDELGLRDALREILRMPASHPAQPRDADPQSAVPT